MATRGTGFINPQVYAALNSGGGRRMADSLSTFLQGQEDEAAHGLRALQDAYGRQVDAGTVRYTPGGLDSAAALARSSATYTGPSSLQELEGYEDVLESGRVARRDAELAGDYYGRQALLADRYGQSGTYTPGMGRFDSFLAGATSQGMFDDRSGRAGAFGERLGAANTASQQQAATARETSAANAARYVPLSQRLATEERRAADEASRRRFEEQRRQRLEEQRQQNELQGGPKRYTNRSPWAEGYLPVPLN